MEGSFLYLRDHHYKLVAVMPELINMLYSTHRGTKALVYFTGEEAPRLFSHSVDEILEALDTFYNAS
jgi:hypothetical protein